MITTKPMAYCNIVFAKLASFHLSYFLCYFENVAEINPENEALVRSHTSYLHVVAFKFDFSRFTVLGELVDDAKD